MMDPEDKFFIVMTDVLNVRSTGEVEKQNDLGAFNLKNGDVIHAVGVVMSGNITFHKFDQIHRDGTRYDDPFDGFPMFEESTTGEYWTAEKGASVWMTETDNPELSTPISVGVPENDPQPTSAKKYDGYRALHYAEGGYDATPLNMPEVIPPPVVQIGLEMTEAIQKMSFELMQHFNDAITNQLWTKVHDGDRAFTNHQGFGKKGDPRRNYKTGENLSSKNLPKYDKMGRICGGMFIHGIEQDGFLVCKPGIHGINANGTMPDIDAIVEKNWYFFAVTRYAKNVGHFPQGGGGPVAIPFIFDRDVKFPLKYFERWYKDEKVDPLKFYIQLDPARIDGKLESGNNKSGNNKSDKNKSGKNK
jgi:hypothetical protein